MSIYKIYTDGSCSGNGTANPCGGWAYLALKDGKEIFKNAGMEQPTTNNRMELEAIIRSLDRVAALDISGFDRIEVYTDSAYVFNCYEQKWYLNWQRNGWVNAKKQPVLNKDLWEKLIPYFYEQNISFHKVKGHNGDKYNEIVDKMAVDIRS